MLKFLNRLFDRRKPEPDTTEPQIPYYEPGTVLVISDSGSRSFPERGKGQSTAEPTRRPDWRGCAGRTLPR